MTTLIEGTTTIRTAKLYDSNFDINTEKAEVLEQWTTSEQDFGYGYTTASFKKSVSFTDTYVLWLDGEMSEIIYSIAIVNDKPEFAPTHELISGWM